MSSRLHRGHRQLRGLLQTTDSTARRTVVRVEDKIPFGADSHVDDRNVLVMNTKTEIRQAFNDFHSGKFGDIPRQARLKYR